MFKHRTIHEALIEERKKNEALKAQTVRNASDIDYIAMMTDVELETAEEAATDEQV